MRYNYNDPKRSPANCREGDVSRLIKLYCHVTLTGRPAANSADTTRDLRPLKSEVLLMKTDPLCGPLRIRWAVILCVLR